MHRGNPPLAVDGPCAQGGPRSEVQAVAMLQPVLFERIACHVEPLGLSATFPGTPALRSTAEEQWDGFLARLRLRGGAWEWPVSCTIATSDGAELVAEIQVGRRFSTGRQAVITALLAQARDAPPMQATAAAQLASRLLGRPLTLDETPPTMRPARGARPVPHASFRSLRTLARLPNSPTTSCACGRSNVPRLRAYQDQRPVEVLPLHTEPGTPALCRHVVRLWALIDARDPMPLHQPPPSMPPAEERVLWLERHLGSIPAELGGPQADHIRLVLDGCP